MTHDRIPLIAGNWKANVSHRETPGLIADIQHSMPQQPKVEVAVFPPFTSIPAVTSTRVEFALGAQDVSAHGLGAFTGDVPAELLRDLGVSYVLIGHSERRALHEERDTLLAAKIRASISSGLIPVICVGETAEEHDSADPTAVPSQQLSALLQDMDHVAAFVVAYEPVWAIGTGNAASPDDVAAATAALRAVIRAARDEATAASTRIIYGGSVTADNTATLLAIADVDGLLVGGASIDPSKFTQIIANATNLAN